MVAMRTGMHRLQELVRLHRQGSGPREVARLLGMSPNTERDYRRVLARHGVLTGDPAELPELELLKQLITAELPARPAPAQSISTLAPYRAEIEAMLERGAGPRAVFDALRLTPGFACSLAATKRFCHRLKAAKGVRAEDVAIPVITVAGEVAQIDFGYVGHLVDPSCGALRQAWVFVMVLGHSRHMFAEIVFDQRAETFIALHVRAFAYFGGVPRVVVPDNLKAAVIRAAFSPSDTLELNRSYRELAKAYGFKIDPTPPRAPKKKGKVERAVRYVKSNFFVPRSFIDIKDAREQLVMWLRDIAAERVHGTTGRTPRAMFEEERSALLPLPTQAYELVHWKKATVYPDSHVLYARRLYSVPWRLIGREVWVRATPSTVAVYLDDERVATHARAGATSRSTVEAHLPEHRRDYRERQRSYWEERAATLGDDVAAYVRAVFDSDDVLYQLRSVIAAVKHLESFPRERARAACRRALHFGTFKYQGLKDILRRGLDMEHLDTAPAIAAAPQQSFRFARLPSEFTTEPAGSQGDNHELH